MHEAPPLTPPATEDELAWWKTQRASMRNQLMLRTAVPFLGVWLLTNFLKYSKIGLGLTITLTIMAGLVGVAQWLVTEPMLRSQSIRWKRVREDLAAGARATPS